MGGPDMMGAGRPEGPPSLSHRPSSESLLLCPLLVLGHPSLHPQILSAQYNTGGRATHNTPVTDLVQHRQRYLGLDDKDIIAIKLIKLITFVYKRNGLNSWFTIPVFL